MNDYFVASYLDTEFCKIKFVWHKGNVYTETSFDYKGYQYDATVRVNLEKEFEFDYYLYKVGELNRTLLIRPQNFLKLTIVPIIIEHIKSNPEMVRKGTIKTIEHDLKRLESEIQATQSTLDELIDKKEIILNELKSSSE